MKSSSDIDLLVVAKSGRIFTARFLSLFITYLTGLKRGKDDKDHGGKFCLNYFLTDKYLTIPHNRSEQMNKYCALNYSKSILTAGDERLFNSFIEANSEWMRKYLDDIFQFSVFNFQKRLTAKSYPLKATAEWILSGWFGDSIEKLLRRIQIAKITQDPRTQKFPELIVVNDKELRFHPPKG